MLNETEHLLMHVLLHHGGICNTDLVAKLLQISDRRARDILLELHERGYVRRVYIEALRDAKNYFQITSKAARLLGHPGANSVRTGMDSGWILRGLTRLWFRVNYPVPDGAHFLNGRHEIEATFEGLGLRSPGSGKDHDRFAETVISATEGTLEAWSFPAVGRPLRQHAEGVVLRYADTLPTVLLGWVIDPIRVDELRRIVSGIAGVDIPIRTFGGPVEPGQSDTLDNLLGRQKSTRTAADKIALQRQIDALRAPASSNVGAPNDPLAKAFLPVVVHDLY